MAKGFFIAGTDTGVGKTSISAGLMQALLLEGRSVAPMKPIASGAVERGGKFYSEDAEILMAQSSVDLDYELVNPYCFEPPVSPNIAAKNAGVHIEPTHIYDAYQQISQRAEFTIVEGVGGWMVPISETHTMADIAEGIGLPVILVVALRLGCINHAYLTVESIQKKGLPIAAWVANMPDRSMQEVPQVVNTLQSIINAPSLGIIPPFIGSPRPTAFSFLQIQSLLD